MPKDPILEHLRAIRSNLRKVIDTQADHGSGLTQIERKLIERDMAPSENGGTHGAADFFEARGRHGNAPSATRFLERASDGDPMEEDHR